MNKADWVFIILFFNLPFLEFHSFNWRTPLFLIGLTLEMTIDMIWGVP